MTRSLAANLLMSIHGSVKSQDTDLALAKEVKNGNRKAFDSLMCRHQEGLYRLCLRYAHNAADAQDLTQQSFVRAYKRIASFRGDSTFRAWLYRIAVHQSLSHLRKRPSGPSLDLLPEGEQALSRELGQDQNLSEHQERQKLSLAIASLAPKQRLVVELRGLQELSFAEVAVIAKCSENTARVNYHHALANLRKILPTVGGANEEQA